MEITSFILGVCAVIVLLMIVGTSVNLMSFRVLKKDFNNLERNLDNMHHSIYRELENIRADVETKEGDMVRYADQLNNNLYDEMNKIYPYIDSRTDKMDSKFTTLINTLEKEIGRVEKGYKEKINY